MSKAQPVKVYCNMHDIIFNSNDRKMAQAEDGKIACPCCNRFTDGIENMAFTLPEAQNRGNAPSCNCFFGTIEAGSYKKEEIADRLNGKTHIQHVLNSEAGEKDFNEMINANKCRIHGCCDNAQCEGILM